MELDTLEYANTIVSHYTQNPPSIRQRTVYFQLGCPLMQNFGFFGTFVDTLGPVLES